ncbi:MAG: C-GCAxxG-C-C family (seleno)protein [Coriobacteriia bacterium]
MYIRHARAADSAREHYAAGCNCAQAVIGALAEVPGLPSLSPSLGAGYTTGIGGSGCVCGALAGGVAVLGEYASNRGLEPVAARQLAEELSATLHARFAECFGAACCRIIKRGQTEGSDEWLAHCTLLIEETARMVADVAADHSRAVAPGRWSARDVLSVARRAALGGLAGGGIALLAALFAPVAHLASAFSAVVIVLALAAIILELGGPGLRRMGRVLRTSGVTAAALLAVAALLVPTRAAAVLGPLFATGPATLVAARAALAVCALVVAASAAFAMKRHR